MYKMSEDAAVNDLNRLDAFLEQLIDEERQRVENEKRKRETDDYHRGEREKLARYLESKNKSNECNE